MESPARGTAEELKASIASECGNTTQPSTNIEEEAMETPTRGTTEELEASITSKRGKTTQLSSNMEEEAMETPTRRGVKCTICKKMLPTEPALKRHRLQHRVRCGTCEKSFFSRDNLLRHLKKIHRGTAEVVKASSTSERGKTTQPSSDMEEEAMETPTGRSSDDQAHDKDASRLFTCDHCKQHFSRIWSLNRHIRELHRLRDEATSNVPDKDSDATIPYTELEAKAVKTFTTNGISNQHLKSIESTSILKPDEIPAFKLNVFSEAKVPVSDLPTLPGQEDRFQNVIHSTTSNVSDLSVKLEPEDLDEKAILPHADGPTVVSAAEQVVTVVVKEEAPSDDVGDSEGSIDPPQGSCTKGKSATKAGAVKTMTVRERMDYLQAQKELHPFPKKDQDWEDLRIKFRDTCPYCPLKEVQFEVAFGKWRTHIKQHMKYSKKREKSLAGLWAKHTPSCLYCARDFSSKLSWSRHLRRSHGVSASPDKEFQVLFKAMFGLSSLDEAGDFESGLEAECFWFQLRTKYDAKCPVCTKEYSDKRKWKDHMLSHHTSNRIGCSQCNASFKCKRSARKHEETMHNENGETFATWCAKCNKTFTGPNQKVAEKRLKAHKLRMHPDPALPLPFLCQTCGKGFHYKPQLRTHSLQHTDDRPFACEKCDKTFKINRDLRRHVQTFHEGVPRKKSAKSKLCSDCGEVFTPQQYKVHVLSHTQEKPFKCSECNGAFTTKDSLKQHVVFHQGNREYLCDICKSSFFLKHHLVAHMKTHTDEKPFHCDICSSDFRLKHHLQAHRSRLHGIQSGTTRGPKAKVIPGLESKPSTDSSA